MALSRLQHHHPYYYYYNYYHQRRFVSRWFRRSLIPHCSKCTVSPFTTFPSIVACADDDDDVVCGGGSFRDKNSKRDVVWGPAMQEHEQQTTGSKGAGAGVGKRDGFGLLTTTEVSTCTGMRWVDICGRTSACADGWCLREENFIAYAMGSLCDWELPPDMIEKVSQTTHPMPSVHVGETWACLTLRCERHNPGWLSSILNAKVKDLRLQIHDRRSRSQQLGERMFEDESIYLDDMDRVRGRVKGGSWKKQWLWRSTHPTVAELTDFLHIFLLRETHLSNGKGSMPGNVQMEECRCGDAAAHSNGEEDVVNDPTTQWRMVTVHRYPVPFVEKMFYEWPWDKLREQTWTAILRRLLHHTTMGVQAVDYKYAERLDEIETLLFRSSSQISRLSNVLAQVHIIHRRAKTHAGLLRETQRCYVKLLSALDMPLEAQDQKEILFLSNALSLAEELHDHSRSLMALQFSVAAYKLEDNLRVLTIFTTFFVPLELITSWFGTNFVGLGGFFDDSRGMCVVTVMLVVTAVLTNVWMRQRVMVVG